jgi:hypothetical protein
VLVLAHHCFNKHKKRLSSTTIAPFDPSLPLFPAQIFPFFIMLYLRIRISVCVEQLFVVMLYLSIRVSVRVEQLLVVMLYLSIHVSVRVEQLSV